MFFHKKTPKFGVIKLQPVQDFKDHPHVVTTYQYPNRVFAVCPICGTYARLEWKDTSGRLWHRTFGQLPQMIQVVALLAGIVLLLVLTLLHL